MGQYLINQCGIQDRRGTEYADDWNKEITLCTAERANQLKNQAENGNIINTLMMMKANRTKGIIIITPYIFFRNQEAVKDILLQMGFDISDIDNMGADSAWVGVYDEKNEIALCELVNTEINLDLSSITKAGDVFNFNYKGYNHFGCSYNGEVETGLHNQMMMVYLFDESGNLLVQKGFGTS